MFQAVDSKHSSPKTPAAQPGRNSRDQKEKPQTTSHIPEVDIHAIMSELKTKMAEMKKR